MLCTDLTIADLPANELTARPGLYTYAIVRNYIPKMPRPQDDYVTHHVFL